MFQQCFPQYVLFRMLVSLRMTYHRSKQVARLDTLLSKYNCVLIDTNFVYYKIINIMSAK
jgi:hypothetical protein